VNSVQPRPSFVSHVVSSIYLSRRLIATGLAVVLAVFFGFHVMVGRNGLNVYQAKRAEDKSLQKQIIILQQENERLQDHVERLKNDPDAIEHEAREKLHYARPDEVIWTLNEQRKPSSASNDAPQTLAAVTGARR
jgi:cell division protein FtsB